MSDIFDSLFDASSVKGFIALATIHAHLFFRFRRQARVVKALEEGHSGDVQKHRELGAVLAKVPR